MTEEDKANPDAALPVRRRRYDFLSRDDATAKEIGHVVMQWAALEDLIDSFIAELLHLEEEDPLSDVIAGNIEFRSKISALKGLAAVRAERHAHLAPDWLSAMISILDHVDNDLRPARNLIVHAHWFKSRGVSPRLVTKKTKIIRPQAFLRKLETRQVKVMRLTQIRALSHKTMDVWFDMLHMFWYSMRPYPSGFFEDGSPMPTLTLQRYLREVGHTLRAVRIAPEKKRTSARHPTKGRALRMPKGA